MNYVKLFVDMVKKKKKNLVKYDYLCSVCGLDYLPPPYVGCIAMMATMATQWKMGIDV